MSTSLQPDATAAKAGAWKRWFDEQRAQVSRIFEQHVAALKASDSGMSPLTEAVAYSLLQGGKRLRPILVRESCRVAGGKVEQAIPAAIAVECIHTFSLIHDDLPAMDDDDLRRGQPTSHKVFGEAMAILAGDWLVAHAFNVLADERLPAATSVALVRALAVGSLGMVEGQGVDVHAEGQTPRAELVEFIHLHKTAALIEACCRMGAISAQASAETVERMTAYGRALGLAFQIADDLLDCTSSTETLGKRAGKDAEAEKQTYPAVYGVDESRARAKAEIDGALEALASFGPEAEHLRSLGRFVITRDR